MVGTSRSPPAMFRARRRRSVLLWAALACAVAVVIEVGAVTNAFGLLNKPGSGGSSGPPGPNPNPYDENVTSLVGALAYHGSGQSPFPSLNGVANLCVHCPIAPMARSNGTTTVAVVWIYFNVTYTGSNNTHIANFTLTTSGSDPDLFTLIGVFVPPYGEASTQITFWQDHPTWAMLVQAEATSIPNDGSTGYQLTLGMTSP